MVNFKDGVIRDGSSVGSGNALGNIKDGVIRSGASKGSGNALGNIKDGIIRNGSTKGSGNALFNVKGDVVRNGSSLGSGNIIGKVGDYSIKGMERELDAEIVAAYHFLVKRSFRLYVASQPHQLGLGVVMDVSHNFHELLIRA